MYVGTICWEAKAYIISAESLASKVKAHVCRYDRIEQQREQVSQRRAELGLILESQVRDPNAKAEERRKAAGLMASAIGKAWAHQQLLDAHSAQLRQQQDALSRPQNAGLPSETCPHKFTLLGVINIVGVFRSSLQ